MDSHTAHPRDNVSPIFRRLTPIGYHYSNRSDIKFVATGFFYYHEEGVLNTNEDQPNPGHYLITNKHVVNPPGEKSPDALVVNIRESSDIRETTRKIVDLTRQGDPIWRDHPDNEKVDVVAVPIDFDIKETSLFHRSSIPNSASTISGGELSKVIGYPDLLPEFHKLPIIRDALVSSPYPVAYNDSPFFFIDAKLHDGMSGSPVFYSPKSLELDVQSQGSLPQSEQNLVESLRAVGPSKFTRTKLLGIYSDEQIDIDERISIEDIQDKITSHEGDPDIKTYLEDIEDRLSSIEQESGLNRVWHAHLLEEIIDNTA